MMSLRPAVRRALAALSVAASMRFGGCFLSQIPSADVWAKGWVGETVQRLIKLVERPVDPVRNPTAVMTLKPNAYTLPNGNSVYLLKEARDCSIHFEVNRDHIIVGYRLEGTTCD